MKAVKKMWHFLWHEDSLLSWVASVIVMFLLIRYLIYPAAGLALGTSFPVVAVVSESMEHSKSFDAWWTENRLWYENHNITKEEFGGFSFRNGFNRGDIIVLVGTPIEKLGKGDVITYQANRKYPIIHRVVDIERNGEFHFKTKGDNNRDFIISAGFDERSINEKLVLGRAVFRIPYLGWVKIAAVSLITGGV